MRSRIFFILLVTLAIIGRLSAQSLDPDIMDSLAKHVPGSGFPVINSKIGTLIISPYVSLRYLNQMATDDSYVDDFNRVKSVDPRNDFQMHKIIVYFRGWLFDPKLRWVLNAWCSNANMGQTAQAFFIGSLQYDFKKWLGFGGGTQGIPGARSLLYSWPNWLRMDCRPMAEEFFRPSYTFGIWIQGELAPGLNYKSMLANNLSELGIDAGQLDSGFDTWGSSLWWTTNDFGKLGPYGDFEHHCKPATILTVGFTRSNETKQSQPGVDDPENTQIRLSDGTGIFALDAFVDSSQVTAAKYEMLSASGGIKYRGFSLDGEFFTRWISQIEYVGNTPPSSLFDNGFSVQASAMIIKKTLQLYGAGSYVNGQYGYPYEIIGGVNWYVLKNRILRFNGEVIFPHNSPVGYLAYPTAVGSNGHIFMLNLEVNF
ncbi:hypothetical protein [Polluticoccus soli]|uniref:hypothetical protein n=1 Tax=Polluticoccus soli TaxID=3034150 RepID=UPI0023E16280|nr:hypothetical protein [Flavipsychrobacter sp. JY13-12]